MQEVDKIKQKIAKKATVFETGGFKPEYTSTESWIGKVYLYKDDEEIPKDENGNLMIPLFQLCLDDVENIPDILSETKALTIFIAEEPPIDLTANGKKWLIREYKKSDDLLIKDLSNPNTFLKPFPLKPQHTRDDYPVWDGGGLTREMEVEILELERSGIIEGYYDITENQYGHKLGGYPSFCQPGVYLGDNFEFVFQIASDDKARLNIVDSGTMYFAKNAKTGEWIFYCDFY